MKDALRPPYKPTVVERELFAPGEHVSETLWKLPADRLPFDDRKRPISLVAEVKSLPADALAKGEVVAMESQLSKSQANPWEENVIPTKPAKSSILNETNLASLDAAVGDDTKPLSPLDTAGKADLAPQVEANRCANSSALTRNAQLPSSTPIVGIKCPRTYSATDPPSTRLRHMVANSPSIILCPGVYDGLSARIALHVGFKGMYMTGAGTTASCLGASDLGIAHLHDMRTNAEMIANLAPDGPPLIADMDTGYGGPLVISRAVKQYARAGVAAFHIEDQVPEKRCGHLAGKEVVDTDTYMRRIRACVDAREQIRSDIIIVARTDALQSRGYKECIDRLGHARDLGADMGILEGVPTKQMAAQAVRDLAPWPLCYNSVENGHSPLITAAEAQEMGYRLMIFSFAGIAPAYAAIMETFTRLRDHGVTGSAVRPKTIFEVCGLEEEMRLDQAAGGSAFSKGV
ncbi:MAG: hypothetical protein LQ338_003281 [Usnochroma carphineum]|nr:MAG: hypothetical protein LQ338_003281 [Usnochroma carphineum]